MGTLEERERRLRLDYERIAETAERLANAEEEAARTFEWLAQRGGERALHRQALADDARRQMTALRLWAVRLRSRMTE